MKRSHKSPGDQRKEKITGRGRDHTEWTYGQISGAARRRWAGTENCWETQETAKKEVD